MTNVSATQLSNFAVLAGLIVIIAEKFGWILDTNQVVFVIAALWSLGFTAYSYWNRFKKGDLNVLGGRK